MLGAIAGDIIGSVFERRPIKTKTFPLFSPQSTFTDDTVLTVAVAQAICSGNSYLNTVRETGLRYPNAGYGASFSRWLYSSKPAPYDSWGNGSAMRVSPVGFGFDSVGDVLRQAELSAEITHSHPEGRKGAMAAALAVYLARCGENKDSIRREISVRFHYDLNRSVDEIRPEYSFEISCQKTVPEALICFLDSISYEDAIRNSISLGGDSDTLACITGAIAEAFYQDIPAEILKEVKKRLPEDLWFRTVSFYRRYGIPGIIEKLDGME